MKALLGLEDGLYERLIAHLLPDDAAEEQAAFLFARVVRSEEQLVFSVIASELLERRDFAAQEGDYLELADEKRASLIKRAHDSEASLIEMHSHLGPWPAAFSPSDRLGLRDTVAHVWWRLRKRPYIALVFAKSGFDALLWLDDPRTPRPLDGLIAGDRTLRPTNLSLKGWR
jgi:hypothetical protein